ncbi:MAG: MTAP family purine nucleoside phosphorylase [Candidatus Micrarchaeota archaeon]|nr:MTAP family purine nucleoside phosphorylase [Candidatus Micrarchaeota archaeon]
MAAGKTEIGIIGGSGFYELLKNPRSIAVRTAYGRPSSKIAEGGLGGRRVAFVQRHGEKHTIPPHRVPYRANIEALAEMGAKRVLASSACGSLSSQFKPGEFVFFDQFVNMTSGRADTFFDADTVMHVSAAEPYCNELRSIAIRTARAMKLKFHGRGTVVVINGPRFSSKAESRFFSTQDFELISMTQYPEAMLARERRLCYLGIGLITDYDAGLVGQKGVKPVAYAEVGRMFAQNIGKTKELIRRMLEQMPQKRSCSCSRSLEGALATQN